MNRNKFLRILGQNPERWAAQHDIEPFTHPCQECGRMLTTSIPFVYGSLRGLIAPTCACGNEITPYSLVRDARFGDLFSGC